MYKSNSNTNQENLDITIFQSSNGAEDISIIRNQGIEVHDDNGPIPENIPVTGSPSTSTEGLNDTWTWQWDGIDCCQIITPENEEPSITNMDGLLWDRQMAYMIVFIAFLPLIFFFKTMFMIQVMLSSCLESLL